MIVQPTNQKRLTNVVVVRLKRCGKRFEVACYPNKVVSWRNGIEKNIDEVLQIHSVFVNVSKGEVAKKQVLTKCFGTDNEDDIVKMILEKGVLQVSEKERIHFQEKMMRDISQIIAEKCVDPETRRPLTVGLVERALKDIHFSVNPSQGTKQQALKAIKLLEKHIPLARAQMKIRITTDTSHSNNLKRKCIETGLIIEQPEGNEEKDDENEEGEASFVGLLDPGIFRSIDQLVKEESGGTGVLEVVNLCVVEEREAELIHSK